MEIREIDISQEDEQLLFRIDEYTVDLYNKCKHIKIYTNKNFSKLLFRFFMFSKEFLLNGDSCYIGYEATFEDKNYDGEGVVILFNKIADISNCIKDTIRKFNEINDYYIENEKILIVAIKKDIGVIRIPDSMIRPSTENEQYNEIYDRMLLEIHKQLQMVISFNDIRLDMFPTSVEIRSYLDYKTINSPFLSIKIPILGGFINQLCVDLPLTESPANVFFKTLADGLGSAVEYASSLRQKFILFHSKKEVNSEHYNFENQTDGEVNFESLTGKLNNAINTQEDL